MLFLIRNILFISKRLLICLAALLLVACTETVTYAPVINGWKQANTDSNFYIVQEGDTLYSIAWAFGLDYRDLARANHLKPPYAIQMGQRLSMRVTPQHYGKKTYIAKKIAPKTHFMTNKQYLQKQHQPLVKPRPQPEIANIDKSYSVLSSAHATWLWPTRGKLVTGFSLAPGGNKGLDISGQSGQPILAASAGKVVYSGSNYRIYGNLIIIKHNSDYLSAYAFNKVNLVKEGQIVRAGQEVATMGQDNSGKAMLHFEIRYNGKPVNPLLYLKKEISAACGRVKAMGNQGGECNSPPWSLA